MRRQFLDSGEALRVRSSAIIDLLWLMVCFSFSRCLAVEAMPNMTCVEVELSTSQSRIELGQTWELFAAVRNLSDKAIWISDRYSLLVLPSAVRPNYDLNVASQGGTLPEPSLSIGGDDWQRIDAYETGVVFWRVRWDSQDKEDIVSALAKAIAGQNLRDIEGGDATVEQHHRDTTNSTDVARSGRRGHPIIKAMKNFFRQAFIMKPGRYQARVIIHYWKDDPFQPSLQHADRDGEVADSRIQEGEDVTADPIMSLLRRLQSSSSVNHLHRSVRMVTGVKDIDINHSPFVAIVGGALGGLLGFLMLFFSQHTTQNSESLESVRVVPKRRMRFGVLYYSSHAILAVLLGIIITILISQVGDTNFFIAVRINDLWGAITTGLVAELVGIKVLERVLGINVRRGLLAEPEAVGMIPEEAKGAKGVSIAQNESTTQPGVIELQVSDRDN